MYPPPPSPQTSLACNASRRVRPGQVGVGHRVKVAGGGALGTVLAQGAHARPAKADGSVRTPQTARLREDTACVCVCVCVCCVYVCLCVLVRGRVG
jgi:hypothetical protein